MPADLTLQDALGSARPINGSVLDYWYSLRDGALCPTKASFDPTRIPDALPHLLIYEWQEGNRYQIRLTGTAVDQRIGKNETGADPFERIDERGRAQVKADFSTILTRPCGQLLVVRDTYASGITSDVEVIRLPLLDDTGSTTFILSSTEVLQPDIVLKPADEITSLALPVRSKFIDLSHPRQAAAS